MPFRFIKIPIVVYLFFCTIHPVKSQNNTNLEEIIQQLDEKYGIDQQLYRGVKYFPKVNIIKGHAYLFESDFISSKIEYQQKIYQPVFLKYDIELDQLVVKTPQKYGAEIQLVLNQKDIDAFWLDDKYFMQNTEDEIPGRFIQIISADSIACMASYTKDFKLMKSGVNEGFGYTDKKVKFYVKINSTITQVKTKSALLKLLPKAYIAGVKQYLTKHKYRFGKMTDDQWIQLFSYINDLHES